MYYCVKLTLSSRDKIRQLLADNNISVEGMQTYIDHMTIAYNTDDDDFYVMLCKIFGDKTAKLKIHNIIVTEGIIAVGCKGFVSANKHPHITVAVNRDKGFKPVDSNYLDWDNPSIMLDEPIEVEGFVTCEN